MPLPDPVTNPLRARRSHGAALVAYVGAGMAERHAAITAEQADAVIEMLEAAGEEIIAASKLEGLREALEEIKRRCDRIVAGEFGGLDAAREMQEIAKGALADGTS